MAGGRGAQTTPASITTQKATPAAIIIIDDGGPHADISAPIYNNDIGSVDTPDDAIGVAVSGDYAYVADGGSGLQAVDISDPENPVIAGAMDTPSTALGVALSGDYAYVTDLYAGLDVFQALPDAP